VTDEENRRIDVVSRRSEVMDVRGPVWKWTDLGEKPVWTVEAVQPFNVPSLRGELQKQGWTIIQVISPSSIACSWTTMLVCILPSMGS